MKKIVFALLVLGLFALAAYGQTDNTFISKEGGFRITPPAGFDKFEKSTNASDTGDLKINQYSSNLARGTCMMAYYDLPDSTFQSKSFQKILEDARDGAVKKVDGTLLKAEAITMDGNPGMSIYVRIKSGENSIYARADFVVVKPRMYNFLYLSTDEAELSKTDVKDYFRSFHLQK